MSMTLIIWLACTALALITILVVTRIERLEKLGSEAAAGLMLASFPFLFTSNLSWVLLVPAAVLHLWLIILPARLLMGRLERQFLRRSTQVNALAGLAGVLGVAALYVSPISVNGEIAASLWLSMTLGVSVVFLGQLIWNMQHYNLDTEAKALDTKDLPTVSLCIPARNEDHALTECLQAALASNYPKLEILVLDDCSQDTTSSIIRSFAHDGVRFFQGDLPAEGWLGKNQAMQTLAQQASGDYVIFASVDTHFEPNTISEIVEYTLAHNLQMVSVLPQNRLGVNLATLFPTMNYYWRLVWPITRRHVPVSSRFWLIKATSFRQLGVFASVSRKILPEESFARRLYTQRSYHFLVGGHKIGMTVAKHWNSQAETSVRLLYPTAKRQPLAILVFVLLVAGIFILPILALIAQLILGQHGVILWLAIAVCVLHTINYLAVVAKHQPKSWYVAVFLWPLVVLQEIGLMVVSMLSYEFGEVNWKGRNVCYPVLGLPQVRDSRVVVGSSRG